MNGNEGIPNNEQVRLIFRDTYNFYTKWIAVKEPNWDLVIAEAKVIEERYPFDLCRKMLVEIVAVIEATYLERSEKMGRELYEYTVYDTLLDKELLSNVSLSEVSRALDIPNDKAITYAKEGYLFKRRYLITRDDKPLDSNFEKEWEKYRQLAKKALRNPEAISRFYVKLRTQATKEG